MALPISIQLFTVREVMKNDYAATLKGLKEIGYDAVEWAGYPAEPAELKKRIDDLGLVSSGAHVGIDAMAEVNKVADDAKTLGYTEVVVPYATTKDVAETEGLIAKLNAAAGPLNDAGLQLCYHNHDHEFKTLDNGQRPIDMIAEKCPGVAFEFDLGWVWVGGEDPAAWGARFAGREPLLHIKDFIEPRGERKMCELGAGAIDFKPTVDAAESWGVKYLTTEQDNFWVDNDPMKSAEISFKALKAMVG